MNRIVFTTAVRQTLNEALQAYSREQVFVLMDRHTFFHCFPLLEGEKIREEQVIQLEAGESHKSLESVVRIWETLCRQGARRNAVLVNIGGGLITDIGGFAASCFKRGIKCINIPTTLLSQVDASVGGKTGINFNGLKNEIGTFSLPEQVIIDSCFLKTLPYRQLLSGFAEMLKHALLQGGEHWVSVMQTKPGIIDREDFPVLLKESVKVKARIVEEDPTEKGIRKALNFGHTVGHALESVAIRTGEEFYHGDAVAYGMMAELRLSVMKKGFDEEIFRQACRFIRQMYPAYVSPASADELYRLMLHDKKNEQEGVNFTLLEAPGVFSIDNYCSREEILEALSVIRKF